MKKKPLTNKSGEVRELMAEDIANFRPAAEVLPKELLAILPKRARGERGPQKTPTKKRLTIRIDPEIERAFRATGPGWQSRINQALQNWLAEHPA